MRVRTTTLGLGIALVLTSAFATAASAQEPTAAEKYCTDKGGNVVELKPTLQPDTDAKVELAGTIHVCQFIKEEGDNVTQVVVDLETLHSEKPTLAGFAYTAKVPSSNSGTAGSNPAASYCPDDLGGTESFGTASSGSWVGALDPGMEAGDAEPLSDTITLCVFADRSAIDDWALLYHSEGTVRGENLEKVMRYPYKDAPSNPFTAAS
jgi:putative hemolysin